MSRVPSVVWRRRGQISRPVRVLPGIVTYIMNGIVLSMALSTTPVHANHPFHVCIGQMQWSAEESHWEVSLRLHPQDLERAMSSDAGHAISMEDEDFDEKATRYLSEQFFIWRRPLTEESATLTEVLSKGFAKEASVDGSSNHDRSQLKWVGKESEKGWLWIHLEMIPPADQADTRSWLIHRIFLDTVERQENSVSIVPTRATRHSLQFKKGTPIQPMRPMPQ